MRGLALPGRRHSDRQLAAARAAAVHRLAHPAAGRRRLALWQRYCLVGLGYHRRFGQTRAFFGEDVPLTIEIANDKPLPLAWLEIEDAVPGAGMRVEPGHTGRLHAWPAPAVDAAFGALVRAGSAPLSRLLRMRGFHLFGPATLRTGDVFGFATLELEIRTEVFLLVYPKMVRLDRLGLPAGDPFGDVPLAASGCSRTRFAPSACANTAPATARGGCTGRRRRARPTSSYR